MSIHQIKKKIRDHRQRHEEFHRERMEWIRARRAEWERNRGQGWGYDCPTGPWGTHKDPSWRGSRPMKHWFFMKVVGLFCWICAALVLVQVINGSFSFQKIPNYLCWILGVLLVALFMLWRMFRPLRMFMKGVKEISNGNLDFQFPMGRSHGEIHYLAENFNLMARRIKEMLGSKDQLLLDVSHELRSPLTRLKLALEMSPETELRESMLQDVAEMETMLTEILETQRLSNGNGHLSIEEVDLVGLMSDVMAKYQGRKPGVRVIETPESLSARLDPARIRTVVQNLLENALKFSDKQKHQVEICLRTEGEKVVLSVRDFGVGIPAQDHEKVFEPFYRVDKSRTKETGGYGLGLSLCREILRAHGGEIRLESQPGQGTRVSAEWPLSAK